MIKKLQLKNFQGHEVTTLEFGPGINSIVGANDSGKTSIFRDIIWILKNRPLGDGIIRKNQSENALTVLETDSHTVTKEKGKKVNEYRLSGVEEPFTAFGQNPPEDIIEALNLDDINIQSQLDSPFLVLSSPGQIAQHIRSISGLDIIDKVVSVLKSRISAKSGKVESKKEELKNTKLKLEELEKIDLDRFENLLTKAEELNEDNRHISDLETSLIKIINGLEEIEQTWIRLPNNIKDRLKKISATVIEQEEFEKTKLRLGLFVDELTALETEIIKISPIDSIISQVELVEKQYNRIEPKISQLDQIIEGIEGLEKKEGSLGREISVEQKNLFNLLDRLEVCPYCTSKLNEKTKKKLLEE